MCQGFKNMHLSKHISSVFITNTTAVYVIVTDLEEFSVLCLFIMDSYAISYTINWKYVYIYRHCCLHNKLLSLMIHANKKEASIAEKNIHKMHKWVM